MSHAEEFGFETEPAVVAKPAPGSLEERIAARRKEIEQRTTELFDVPGYEDVFRVELQVIGGKRQFAVYKRHEHVNDEYQQNLRNAADLLAMATVAFHAVDAEGNAQPAEGVTWKRAAMTFDKTLQEADLEKPGGHRIAIVRLLGEEATLTLVGQWKQWLSHRGVQVDKQLEDFS